MLIVGAEARKVGRRWIVDAVGVSGERFTLDGHGNWDDDDEAVVSKTLRWYGHSFATATQVETYKQNKKTEDREVYTKITVGALIVLLVTVLVFMQLTR